MMGSRFIYSIQKKTCQLFGHNWKYQDYSNYIKSNGDKYDYTASRHCVRCNQYSYFYKSWKMEEKSPLDFSCYFYGINKKEIDKLISSA